MPVKSTDQSWEEWGEREPYFGVITDPRFRRAALTAEAKKFFFESGDLHVKYVVGMIKQYLDPSFQLNSVLDFGCGVGRILVPFASISTEVVGIDVSSSMLLEARKNCDEHGYSNVRLLISTEKPTLLGGPFDLVHSYIVFQHIPPYRGLELLKQLVTHIRPGGVGAFHISYAKTHFSESFGIDPAPQTVEEREDRRVEMPDSATRNGNGDPEMQMNSYHLNQVFFILQCAGVRRIHAEFTDHGGEFGLFIFFVTPLDQKK